MASFPDRSYEVRVPWSFDGGSCPVLFLLHGGGGNRTNALEMSCPQRDAGSIDCLQTMALDAGFVVVIPEGTPQGPGPIASRLRTWNGGGGDGGWQCVSANGCTSQVDERAFFTEVVSDLATQVPIQSNRLFATGLSNGAALSHRLACELPGIRAIASIAGGNQFSTIASCPRSAAIIEVHGTADPCWGYDGGPASCADNNPGSKIDVWSTMTGWAARNGCGATPTSRQIGDAGPSDPTTAIELSWPSCPGGNDVVHVQIVNGGHTWPGAGPPQSGSSGTVSRAISANAYMLEFFKARR